MSNYMNAAKKQKERSDTVVLRETEKIIDASLAIMDELPYDSEGHAFAEQIRELADKLEGYVRGE